MGSVQCESGKFSGKYWILAVIPGLVVLINTQSGFAQGSFHGHARVEKIKGDPSKGYVELYEYKAFLTPVGGNETGYSYHIGDPGTAIDPYTGCITWTGVKPETYTLFTSWGEFYPRGKVVPSVVITSGNQTVQDALQPVDYSAYYDRGSWDNQGSNPIFQTFTGSGNSITRVSFSKADDSKDGQIQVSIHESNGGEVQTWPQIGTRQSVNRSGLGADHWVGWDAGEVVTKPGKTYAVRLYATNGVNIQPYWCNDSLVPNGTGYRGSQNSPAGHDYYIIVFSDSDGTIHTMTNRSAKYLRLFQVYHDRFAQSYTARGGAFAGSSLMATLGGSSGWRFNVRVSVHSGTPGGPQIGPAKIMPCAFAPFAGVAGAAFGPNEVPTVAGQTYWVVYERYGATGFNAYMMNEGNTYAGGSGAYCDGNTWTTVQEDLLINIFEYTAAVPTPTPSPSPTPPPVTPLDVDFNKDGVVDQFDLLILIEHWHESTYVSG